ncbi:MAG: GldG family protein [Planctomycetota bacterium]
MPRASAKELRFNAALSLVLLVATAVFGTVLAERFVRGRVDLSEDGLYALSGATRRLVDRIEDPVTLRVFASERVEDGGQALRAARVRSQLDEIVALRPGSFLLQALDPSTSSEARGRAQEAGFRPTAARRAGMGSGSDDVWLSIELGYRGRLQRIATPRPYEFELQFTSALHALLSDRRIGIGWFGASIDPVGLTDALRRRDEYASTFRYVRTELERRGRFVELPRLDDGRSVPDDIDVLFVVRPSAVHPRAAYEIDQFVQRGGRLVLCLDDPDYDVRTAQAVLDGSDAESSPLRTLAARWGAGVSDDHAWDERAASPRLQVVGGANGVSYARLDSPLLITARGDQLSADLPPTRGLASVQFAWAHPLDPIERANVPRTVRRTDLATTTDRAWRRPLGTSLPVSQEELRAQLFVLRNDPARRFALAALLEGRFPSPWAGRSAPAPAEGSGLLAPDGPTDTAATLTEAAATQVIVFGDADWLRDPPPEPVKGPAFAFAGGLELALNLVDWLVLDPELIELRSRALRPRPLRDFVTEEAEALGVFEADPYQKEEERVDRARRLDRARARATRRQWLTMLVPAGAALLLVLLFGAAWNLIQTPRRSDGAGIDDTDVEEDLA